MLRIKTRTMSCRQRGFTLLEIMVVVVLIALTVTMVGLNLDRDVDQVAQLEARRFAKLLSHLQDESILSGKAYAIAVDEQDKKYSFLESPGEWTPVVGDDVLRDRYFPDYLRVRFEVLQSPPDDRSGLLIVESSGDITPFELIVFGERYRQIVTLDDTLDVKIRQVGRDEG